MTGLRAGLTLLLFLPATVSAQPLNGIRGTVADATGAVIPGALVTLLPPKRLPGRKMPTDSSGQYRFEGIAPGNYQLMIDKDGFERFSKDVTVASDASITVDATLTPAQMSETVTVTEAPGFAVEAVTSATKTPTAFLDIPQSVQSVNTQLMQSQAARSMADVVRNVSTVSLSLGEGRRDHFQIRGFSAVNDEYIDGVRDDALYFRDLSSIQEVDVVEGPAAALFGRGSSGGLINRITKQPSPEGHIGEVSFITGSYGVKRTETDLGDAFFDGKLSARLTGAWEDSGSFRDYFNLNRYTASPSLLWRPDQNTDVLFQADYLNDARLPDRGIPSWNGAPVPVQLGAYYGYPEDDHIRSRVLGTAARVERRAGGHWTLRDVFRRTAYTTDFSNTYAGALVAPELVTRGQYNATSNQQNLFNQTEAVFTGSLFGMRHVVLAGFEVGHQELNTIQFTGTADPVALYNPILTRPNYSIAPSRDNDFTGTIAGAYLQDQISWGRWNALLGARHDEYRQSLDNFLPSSADLARTDAAWSPRIGLVYRLANPLSVYATFSRTFDPSGEGLSLATNNADLKPERSRNLETGIKTQLPGGRLIGTVSVFRLDRTNIKTTDPANPLQLIQVGAQRTDGVETSISGNVWKTLNVAASYAYMNPYIRQSTTVTSGVAIEGNLAALTPRNNGSLWGTYRWKNGFGIGGGACFAGRQFTSSDNLVALPGYVRFDANLSYRTHRWEAALNIRNLLDRTYYETANSDFQILPGSPVNGLLTVRYRW